MLSSPMIFAITAFFAATSSAAAAPAPVPETYFLNGTVVYIRGEGNTYSISAEHSKRFATEYALSKRATAYVQACYTSSCDFCHSIYNGDFATFTCLDAANTACMIVSNLEDAKINFWNHAGCNHGESTYHGCSKPATHVNAPGTNSIGIQVGC